MAVFPMMDPTLQAAGAPVALAERPADLRGRRLVLMDNGKNNARQLLEAVYRLLEPELAPAEVRWRSVPTTAPAPDALLDEIAAECDLVVEAVGD
jgi:nucleotide-binding universal stress UspA family protein